MILDLQTVNDLKRSYLGRSPTKRSMLEKLPSLEGILEEEGAEWVSFADFFKLILKESYQGCKLAVSEEAETRIFINRTRANTLVLCAVFLLTDFNEIHPESITIRGEVSPNFFRYELVLSKGVFEKESSISVSRLQRDRDRALLIMNTILDFYSSPEVQLELVNGKRKVIFEVTRPEILD